MNILFCSTFELSQSTDRLIAAAINLIAKLLQWP